MGGAQGQVASQSSRCKQGAPGRTACAGRAQQALGMCAPTPSMELAAWTIGSMSGESAGNDFWALGVCLQMHYETTIFPPTSQGVCSQ